MSPTSRPTDVLRAISLRLACRLPSVPSGTSCPDHAKDSKAVRASPRPLAPGVHEGVEGTPAATPPRPEAASWE